MDLDKLEAQLEAGGWDFVFLWESWYLKLVACRPGMRVEVDGHEIDDVLERFAQGLQLLSGNGLG